MRKHFVTAIIGALLLAVPAYAENALPSEQVQEKIIKTSLLTFNVANLTRNYTVLQARLAKPFREQFSQDKFKQAFKTFAYQKLDLSAIVFKPPVATTPSKIDERGALVLRGYSDTSPSRVTYELDFIPSETEWKLLKINVNVKAAARAERVAHQPS